MLNNRSLFTQKKLMAEFKAAHSATSIDEPTVQDLLSKVAELDLLNKLHERKRNDADKLFKELEQKIINQLHNAGEDELTIVAGIKKYISDLRQADLTNFLPGLSLNKAKIAQLSYALLQSFLLDWHLKHKNSLNSFLKTLSGFFGTTVNTIEADERVTLLESENQGTDIILTESYASLLEKAIVQGYLITENSYESTVLKNKKPGDELYGEELEDFNAYKEALANYNKKLLCLISEDIMRGPLNEHMVKVNNLGQALAPIVQQMQRDKVINLKDAKTLLEKEITMLDYLHCALKPETSAEERIDLLEKAQVGEKDIAYFIEKQTYHNPLDDRMRFWGIVGLVTATIVAAIGIACLVALTQGGIFGIAIALTAPKLLVSGATIKIATDASIGLIFGSAYGLLIGAIGGAVSAAALFLYQNSSYQLKEACKALNHSLHTAAEKTPQHTVINRSSFFCKDQNSLKVLEQDVISHGTRLLS